MNLHADKTQENKSQLVSAVGSQKNSGDKSIFQLVDNRPEAITQRKLQEMTNNRQKSEYTNIRRNGLDQKNATIQRFGEEEEPLIPSRTEGFQKKWEEEYTSVIKGIENGKKMMELIKWDKSKDVRLLFQNVAAMASAGGLLALHIPGSLMLYEALRGEKPQLASQPEASEESLGPSHFRQSLWSKVTSKASSIGNKVSHPIDTAKEMFTTARHAISTDAKQASNTFTQDQHQMAEDSLKQISSKLSDFSDNLMKSSIKLDNAFEDLDLPSQRDVKELTNKAKNSIQEIIAKLSELKESIKALKIKSYGTEHPMEESRGLLEGSNDDD